ncbi:hypothetical protein D3C87_324570 [compost metagenome]
MASKENTASMMPKRVSCSFCKWPVVHCCANDEMATLDADYIIYCSNKGCHCHGGTPMGFSDWPTWINWGER